MLGAVAEGRLRSGAYVGSVRVPLGMNGRANRCGQRGRSLQDKPKTAKARILCLGQKNRHPYIMSGGYGALGLGLGRFLLGGIAPLRPRWVRPHPQTRGQRQVQAREQESPEHRPQASPSGFRRRQQRAQRPLPLRQAQRPAHQEWVFSQRLPQAASQGQPDWAHMEGPRTCRSTSRPAFSWRNSRQRLHQRQYHAPTESSSCSREKQSFLIWNVLQAAIIASRFVKDDSPCGPAQT